MYMLKDNTTNSEANLNSAKTVLTQDEFWALVAANAEGDPGSAIAGHSLQLRPYNCASKLYKFNMIKG